VPIRLAGVLSDERRAEGMASGTLQLDGDDVIDRHTRVPRGPAFVVFTFSTYIAPGQTRLNNYVGPIRRRQPTLARVSLRPDLDPSSSRAST
jgi:hypothetical protein